VPRVVTQPSMRGTFTQLLCAAVLGLTLSGCAQSEGERCEIDSDCATGLVCNASLMTGNGICGRGRTTGGASDAGPGDGSVLPPLPDGAADVSVGSDAVSTDLAVDVTADVSRDSQPDVTAPAPDGGAGN
jgi:hypothetical protein